MAIQVAGGTGTSVSAPGANGVLQKAHTRLTAPPAPSRPSRRGAVGGGKPLPGPRGYPLIGMLPDLFRHVSALPLLKDAWRTYGDAVQVPLGPYKAICFTHPDAVKQIMVEKRDNYPRAQYQIRWLSRILGTGLVSSEGELWRKRRHLMHKLFTVKAVQGYATSMASAVQDVIDGWERRLANDQPDLELNGEMARLSMDALGRSVLGFDARSSLDQMNEAIVALSWSLIHQAPTPFPPPLWLPLPENVRFKRARRQFDELIYEVIRARRATLETDTTASDVLSLMLRAQDDDGEPMSDEHVRDEALTIYAAGHESTAIALGWVFYAIAQHPDVERRLHEEVDRELGDALPTAEVVERLTYTDMVIRETLRLYPPFTMIPKDVREDDEIDGYRVPRGSVLVVSPYLTQRHPDFWPEPERFDPERHASGQAERRHRFSWIPFGGGSHACLGAAFSLLEMKIAVAMIARRHRLTLQRPTYPLAMLAVRPVGGLHMRLEPRH